MTTREELLRGVQKVNNARIDSEAIAQTNAAQVPRDDSQPADQLTGKPGTRASANATSVSGAEASLDEYLAARKTNRVVALEEVDDEIARLSAVVKGLRAERAQITTELASIGRLLRGDVNG